MPERFDIGNMRATLAERLLPTITIWNRLEGRPRTVDFSRALRAEVRDSLWMLSRQWQMGEFNGDDAGSPALARYVLSTAPVSTLAPGDGAAVTIDQARPLEALVERRPLDMLTNGGVASLDLRAAMGRRFLKLVPVPYRPAFVARYPFVLPDPSRAADAERVAHLDVWATLQALAGRAMDGYALYAYLTTTAGSRAWDGVTVTTADRAAVTAAGEQLVSWFDAMFEVPLAGVAWDPQRLEHRFAVTASVRDGEKRLVADEYPGGRLDWTAFSVDPAGGRGGGALGDPVTVLPTGTRFNGMPDPRWWAFEDGRTNLGDVRPDTTDLAKLLLIEFALVYGNDWFTIPCSLPLGTIAKVEGLSVTNVFGERTWIEPAGRGVDDDWTRWSMFSLDVAGVDRQPADTSLFLPSTVTASLESEPLEDVLLLRDEIANMVWGVERAVPLAVGIGRRGSEAAAETLAYRTRLVAGAATSTGPATPAAPITYSVMSSVPENWIPFVAVHVPGDVRETQLQRAAMPRLIEGDPSPPALVRPRTSLLRVGLDALSPAPYVVHEEEVPRAGTQVTLTYQRTRWRDGRVVLWLAAQRQTGRGEGSSGLAFDQIIPTPPPVPPGLPA
ncbi:MAG: hypothetical protein ACJ74O_16595 [Frankiaceae bacterium]